MVLAPTRLDPLADRHPPILPAAFRKLDAVAVLAGPLLPAPLNPNAGELTQTCTRLAACSRTAPQAGGAASEAVPGSRTLQILKATARQSAVAFVVLTARLRA